MKYFLQYINVNHSNIIQALFSPTSLNHRLLIYLFLFCFFTIVKYTKSDLKWHN